MESAKPSEGSSVGALYLTDKQVAERYGVTRTTIGAGRAKMPIPLRPNSDPVARAGIWGRSRLASEGSDLMNASKKGPGRVAADRWSQCPAGVTSGWAVMQACFVGAGVCGHD